MTEILTEPVSAPNVWRGDELADASRWIIHVTEEDFADFERALAHVSRKHCKNVSEIRAEDFPLPHFQERINVHREELTGLLRKIKQQKASTVGCHE